MNIPMSWLREYVDIEVSTREFVEDITMAGQKVENFVSPGHEIVNVVIGKITGIRRHPDADKLVICSVDVGPGPEGQPTARELQIVTGATNLYEGAYVPVALSGAILAGGKEIKAGSIRGQLSEGMLCSIEELGATRQEYPEAPENGIYIFNTSEKNAKKPTLGADAVTELELRDEVVEFEITSNRSDCFSVTGIAREAAAAYNKPLRLPEIKLKEEAEGDINQMIAVEIRNPELCPRYIARVAKNVKIEPSPQWMRHRLAAAGVRPINNIVDITNYVMLELGQPMHAFDIDNIAKRRIIVRNAVKGEEFTTLDGITRTLDQNMAVIADSDKAVAVAGVMGGENSMITGNASAILFEAANFNGMNIRITSKKLGLRTDASSKFEKGLDPNLAMIAVNRAAQLVEELCCGEIVKGCVDCYPAPRFERKLNFSCEYINNLLGTALTESEIASYLSRLGIKTVPATDDEDSGYTAIIPTFRPDLEIPADLAEEVARLYGYNRISSTLSSGTPTAGKINLKQTLDAMVRDVMTSAGLCEGISYSFESPKVFDRLRIAADSNLRKTVKIINPLGEDYSIMRTQTAGAMLSSLATNFNRRNPIARLYEIGYIYIPKALPLTELPDELLTLTIGFYGDTDFYALSGLVKLLFDKLGITGWSLIAEHEISFLHPGRAATIMLSDGDSGQKIAVGYLGEAHPEVAENYGIDRPYLAAINLKQVYDRVRLERVYAPLPRFPEISRDLSLLVPEAVPAGSVESVIKRAAGEYLEEVRLFDVYKGSQVGEGYKSISYKLVFRAPERSLKDEEAVGYMNAILTALNTELGIILRA